MRSESRSTAAVRWRRGAAGGSVWYLRLVAALNLVAVLSVPFRAQVRIHNADGRYFTPYLATAGLVSVVLSLFLSVVMRRHKRAAWIFNLGLAGLTLLLMILLLVVSEPGDSYRRHPFNYFSAAVTGLFLLMLLVGRKEFVAKGDRSNIALATAVATGGVAASGGIGTGLVTWANTVAGASWWDRLGYTLARMVTLEPSERAQEMISVPRWVDASINVMSALTLLLVLYVCFRAPRGREWLGEADEQRLRELLRRQGERDSLGYFALRRDKSVIWSPSGKAAIVYRVVGGVTLASGDPIGDPEAWPGAIERWLAEAREHGWAPAVMGASEEAGGIYARHGLNALELGDEAIVERADFTLEGRAMRGLRQACNRVQRAGYTVRVRHHEDIPEGEMAALVDKADQWRDGATERGFSMALGRLGDPQDGRCVMVECYDGDGELRALLSFVPWGERGLSLDLMRRDRSSENGLLEYMVTEVMARSREIGIERVSLNFAMFRSVFERGSRLGAGPVLRLWRSILGFFSRWWQIESLYRANAKYRPIWEPRYLLFAKSSELPRIALASARAEGFVNAPRLPDLFRRRHTGGEPKTGSRP
ncbi:phosphatidylglycerol lysyltransferase domain-containing protein [Streptomyces sp. NPDC046557]|uniref:phosphatidylglycerol lysyltransferase domain-containing protein n=1 Tax=Streptomyces sp. NPDC046557 TaxID=3155372 RepID=UPI0033DCE5C7